MPKPKSKKILSLAPVMHIYCEGTNTEPLYLRKYLDTYWAGDRRRELVRLENTKKNTPLQLVQEAVKHKMGKSCPEGDVFWVVYDRESDAKYTDNLHEQASAMASANGINIALSNVCFELWVFLHLKDNTAPFKSYDDLMAVSDLKKELKKVGVDKYDKSDSVLFDKIKGGIGLARQRAPKMNKHTLSVAPKGVTGPHRLNPYTDMHKLLDAIDEFK
jgi:hypothetical protein